MISVGKTVTSFYSLRRLYLKTPKKAWGLIKLFWV